MDIEGSNGLDERYNTHKGRLYSIKKIAHRVPRLFVGNCKKYSDNSKKLKSNI